VALTPTVRNKAPAAGMMDQVRPHLALRRHPDAACSQIGRPHSRSTSSADDQAPAPGQEEQDRISSGEAGP
jgi:hypothetical protein